VQHYKKAVGDDPIKLVKDELEKIWQPGAIKKVAFPILLRIAIINK
jgi:hypothetical protein